MKKSISGMVFISMVLAPMVLSSQQTLKKLGQWGSASFRDIVVNGNYAYCAAGYAGLEILDISDRTHPVRVAGIETSSRANYICFNNGFIYVSVCEYEGKGCLEIVDVRNPLNPIGRGKMTLEKGCESIVVQGKYVYLNMWTTTVSGLAIINIANPDLPVQAGFVSGGFGGICVRDHYVYAVIERGFAIIDVSNPSAPFITSSRDYGHLCGQIKLKGNCVFLGGDFDLGSNDPVENWFAIINISNPATPRIVWERRDVFRDCLCVVGNYVFLGETNLDVFDISNLSNPVKVNSLDFYKNTLYGMVADSQYLYAATYKGLVVFSIADPRNPVILGSYDHCGYALSVWVFDQKACLAQSHGGLRMLDVSDPVAPKLEWTYKEQKPNDTWNFDEVLWGMVQGDYAYMFYWHSNDNRNLRIINVSDPLHPVSVWTYPLQTYNDEVRRLVVKDRFAYMTISSGNYRGRLEIYDISDPSHPLFLANDTRLNYVDYSGTLAVYGDYIYCTTYDYFDSNIGQLVIFKFSNGHDLIRMGSIQLSNYKIKDIAIRYPYAYGLGWDEAEKINKLQIFDVSNPGQPSLLGCHRFGPKGEGAESIYLQGHYAYVAGGVNGLLSIDVGDPAHPKEVASFNTLFFCNWVHGFGNRVYATDWVAGRMYILEALDSGSILVDLSVKRKAERAWALHIYADIWINIWNEDNIPVSSYLISRAEDKETYVVVKEVSAAEMVANKYNYRDFGLVNKKKYTYKVEALDAQGKVIAVSAEVTI